jgi:hypothetical protein
MIHSTCSAHTGTSARAPVAANAAPDRSREQLRDDSCPSPGADHGVRDRLPVDRDRHEPQPHDQAEQYHHVQPAEAGTAMTG